MKKLQEEELNVLHRSVTINNLVQFGSSSISSAKLFQEIGESFEKLYHSIRLFVDFEILRTKILASFIPTQNYNLQ